MDERKFKEAAQKVELYKPSEDKRRDDLYHYYVSPKNPDKIDLDSCYLYIEWRTGGVDGGSCWDTGEEDNHHSFSGDPEPEFDSLNDLLLGLCPNISFLQYKKIMSNIVQTGERTRYEYYGNYTNFTFKAILLIDLFNALQELGL